MKKLNHKGFTLVEGLLVIIALCLIVGVGLYAHNSTHKTTPSKSVATTNNSTATATKTTAPQKKYLEIPERGIKFELSEPISDAYYAINKDGQVGISVRAFDTNPAFGGGCPADTNDGTGVVLLIVAKVGQPGADEADDPWTLDSIHNAHLTQVGDTYYGFQKGNGPCFDPTNQAASDEFATVEPAFISATPTITKL